MQCLTLGEIAQAVGAEPLNEVTRSMAIHRIAIDSRQVSPGDLFWALAGERLDGHSFIAEAMARGACAAVVSRSFALAGQQPTAFPLVRVDETRKALGRFASYYRAKIPTTVIGVTGSVGKTSTREAIFEVLSRKWPGVRSPRNFNNDIGVPLSLLELEGHHRFAVIEMGASAPGEIAELARIAQPQIGVLTLIGPVHLEGFGSIEGVARAKGELIECLGSTGVAVLNADDPRVRAIGEAARCGVLWYGCQAEAVPLFARGGAIQECGEKLSFRLDKGRRISLSSPGRPQVYAALAATTIARWMGMADHEIVAGLANYRSAPMRCEVVKLNGVTFINDAYNASPPSMAAALGMLVNWPGAVRRILVCGDMKELGAAGADYHRRLGAEIGRDGKVDLCLAVGPMSTLVVAAARDAGMPADGAVHCESIEQAGERLAAEIRTGDVVVVKASRAMRLERVIAACRGDAAA